MWFNWDGTTNGANGIWGMYNPGAAKIEEQIFFIGNQFTMQSAFWGTTTNNTFHQSTTFSATNSWHHLLVCNDYSNSSSTGVIMYIDGVSQAMAHGTDGNLANTSTTQGYYWAPTFPGLLADGAMWDGIQLTQAEATALARGARPIQIRSKSLIGWWPMDGIQSPEPDMSGFANPGTLTGTLKKPGPPFTMFTPRWPMTTPIFTPPVFILMPQIVT
jgi:hypothetical protein